MSHVYATLPDGTTVYDKQDCFSKHLGPFVPSTGGGTHPETFRYGLYEHPERKKFGKMTKQEKEPFIKQKFIDATKDQMEEDFLDMRFMLDKTMTYRFPETAAGNQSKPKGRIFFFHGYGDYSGRYGYWFKHFANNGYDVVAMDFPNFGKSHGSPRWVWGSPYDGLNAASQFIELTNKKLGRQKTFLMGYSLGTLHCLYLSHFFPQLVDGQVLIAPYVVQHQKYEKFKKGLPLIDLVGKVFPTFEVVSGIDKNPSCYEHFHRDPLKTQAFRMSMLSNTMRLQRDLPSASEINLAPTLSLTGQGD